MPGRGQGGGQVMAGFEQPFNYLGHYQALRRVHPLRHLTYIALDDWRKRDRRRFRIPLRFGAHRRVVAATVLVNGHRVRRLRGRNLRSVTLAGASE